MIGDADDGFVSKLASGNFCAYRSLLATGAVRFQRPDFASKAGYLDGKTLLLMGTSAVAEFDRLSGEKIRNEAISRSFPDGGYYILGANLGCADEVKVIVDCGPLGYLSIAAHGHADALAFVLSVAGHEILIDPGTYSYHTEPIWREYFRGTAAHNTVLIDGLDQSVQGGNFMWLRHASARCVAFEHTDESGHFVGEHDGYSRLADPVLHRREITLHGTMIEVSDRIICDGYHRVERCWHYSERCSVTVEGTTVIADNDRVRVRLDAADPVSEVCHRRGSNSPPGGWVSRSFDVKVPTSSVVFVDEIEGTTKLKTIINCEIQRQN